MFRLLILVFMFFSLAACQQKRAVELNPASQEENPLVIDYPAIVVLEKGDGNDLTSYISSQKADHIPVQVLDSVSQAYVFVKSNGDRVSILSKALQNKYELILFNRKNDPIPCRFSDLGLILQEFFSTSHLPSHHFPVKEFTSRSDTNFIGENLPDTTHLDDLLFGKDVLIKSPKKIIFELYDTSQQILFPRSVLPIEWVIHRVDLRRFLKISFENDLITFANTDRYFTNGIAVELQSPILSRLPIAQLMFPYKNAADVVYTAGIYQDMFTPTDTRVAPTLKNDRPYASYLYLGYRKLMINTASKISITSGIDIGYIGPYSPGYYLQNIVHETFPTNDLPLGWETQIKTDLIANYNLTFEKVFLSKPLFLLTGNVNAKAGTLMNSTGTGMQIHYGKFESVYLKNTHKMQQTLYSLFLKTNINTIGRNALLQGGMFNKTNVYTLKHTEISRLVGNAEIGLQFRYKSVGVEMAQHFLSPEYKGGMWHKWGRMSLLFQLK